jgi:OOP family OmpA-OmpF porin
MTTTPTTPRVKKKFKLFIIIMIMGAVFFTLFKMGLIANPLKKSEVASKIDLPGAPANASATVTFAELPSTTEAAIPGVSSKWEVTAWNSQLGAIYANGGPTTTKNSLMEKAGVKMIIERQDDCDQMKADLIKFASDYKSNANLPGLFISIMGDGSAAWLAGADEQLKKIGPDYVAEVIFSPGKSAGEDKLMGPVSWRESPQNAKGGVISGVIRDGDWNIAMKWAADNNIPVNPNEGTYDAEALNFINAKDFLAAADKYITGGQETLKEIKNGKETGKTITKACDAVVTWTPGDVNIAEKKGGLVSIVSTKEYSSQMPNAMITIRKWAKDHSDYIVKMINAFSSGADQVNSYKAALQKGGDCSALVYKSNDGAYWSSFYTGMSKTDKQGLMVELGGSRAYNLADNMNLFGLSGDHVNIYKAVYEVFGNTVKHFYPKLVPDYPKAEDIINTSYIMTASAAIPTGRLTSGEVKTFSSGTISQKISKRSWNITFQTGSAEFTPEALTTLHELLNQLLVANDLKVQVDGYTDNTGDPNANQALSEQRAQAVQRWLAQVSSSNFPEGRVAAVGHGQNDPIASNGTTSGKAKNRRVEITLGK